ncbi:hypothetical protein CFIO01_06648 [Colletotrichum fioriniae PJ7]|uniref:Uncharacterized protein n=1 Tax=Colletotrichum fioriniae PJ7 TaxID=1445577 RepID=A0A010RLN4_9PEZI|nr:hypothetical protein CFIO01_06648 [Colletotrichum fioriniae PJ7]
MFFSVSELACLLAAAHAAAAVTYSVPAKVNTGGLSYAPLEAAPVGLS